MKFDLTGDTKYVTRKGFPVLSIETTPPTHRADFSAIVSIPQGLMVYHYNERGVNMTDANRDIMTEAQQRSHAIGPLIEALTDDQCAIVVALYKTGQKIRAVRMLREWTGTGLSLSKSVGDELYRRG